MNTFEIQVGQSHRSLRIEPQDAKGAYKIFAADKYQDWVDHERPRMIDMPEDGFLGTITVRSAKDFDFDGTGAFTGNEMLSIAGQIIQYSLQNKL